MLGDCISFAFSHKPSRTSSEARAFSFSSEEAALQRATIVMSGLALRIRSSTLGNAKGTGVVMHRLWGSGDSKASRIYLHN